MKSLHWNTVSPLLRTILDELMASRLFYPYRLAGGTALSLQFGHRRSAAIDMYTDAAYGSVDFSVIHNYLKKIYAYVDEHGPAGMGASYFIGDSSDECVKLDLFYTDTFLLPAVERENVRLAAIEDIIAMKMDAVQRGPRKKDFWDIHEIISTYPVNKIMQLHKQRYPYDHDEETIRTKLIDCSRVDDDFEPVCLKGKYWQLIKLDIIETLGAN